MIVAVTGASGFIGRKLVAELLAQGLEVRTLSRGGQQTVQTGGRVIYGDLTHPECQLGGLLYNCDIVYHCAGETRVVARMQKLHVDGTKKLLDAALAEAERSARNIRWVQLSSVGAYGPPRDRANAERIVQEDTPARPAGTYEITKTLADEAVVEAGRAGTLTWSIVRPSNVFGTGMPNGSLRALGEMVRRRMFFYIGQPGSIAPYVHVDDVVAVLLLCGTDDRAKGEIFNVSNDCSLEELVHGMAAEIGVPPPRMRLPEWVVRVAVGLVSKIPGSPFTQQRVNALVQRTRYPTDKLKNRLGFSPRRSVPETIGDIL